MMNIFTMKKGRWLLMVLMFLATMYRANAQERTVSGTVKSTEDGGALPGVSVLIKGTTTGTITDIDGNYSIAVKDTNAVLTFSFVGFASQNIAVGERSALDVELSPDLLALEEVVVVGYGTVKKSDLTGSVASVKSEELNAFPAVSAVQTLQGRAPGVQISANNGGQPGTNYSISIRGTNSINGSNNPLYVVDGFVGAEMPPPADIESIEILKDASALAIYGSRASNGIVMVTTKRGSTGGIKVDFSSSYSTQTTTNKLDLLNAEQFTTYNQNFVPAYENLGSDTDWQDIVYRQGSISNNQLSIRGGKEDVNFYISGTYFDQAGIIIGSDYERYTLSANVDVKANDYLKLGASLYGRRTIDEGVRTQESSGGTGQAGVVGAAMRFNPDLGIYDDQGNYTTSQVGDLIDNPFAMATEYNRERVTDRLQANTYLDIQIAEWLSFKTTLGLATTNWREGEHWPSTLLSGASTNGRASIESRKQSSLLSENYFTATKTFGINDFTWVNGYSYQVATTENWDASASGFINDSGAFWGLNQGSTPGTPNSWRSESTIQSYYTRLNYSLMDRYKLTLTMRRDGSSNFAENKKYGYFPSVALAWNAKDESFLKGVDAIDLLKIRVSYGQVGNQAIGPYNSLATLRVLQPHRAGVNSLTPGRVANSYLGWETTTQANFGVDLGFVGGRVNLTADYYNKRTEDLLYERDLPSYLGASDRFRQNIGVLENKGFEFSINTKNLVGDFKWDTDFNISFNRNKVIELADSVLFIGRSPGHMLLNSDIQLAREGDPIGVFYGYEFDGVYQNGDDILPGAGFDDFAGGEKIRDISGDGELNGDDRTVIGDPNPDFIWAFNNTFSYKNFDLNVFFQGSHGNDALSFTAMELETLSGKSNASTVALRAWTPENPNTDVPMASARPYRVSSRWVYDASYVRLKNVSLGYTVPKELLDKARIRSLRIYASAQNLLTITDYPGLDPEVSYRNSTAVSGLDYASYPNVRTYTFGINLGL